MKPPTENESMIPPFPILQVRGVHVVIDRALTEHYGVSIKRLNEQVKRNAERFPNDFKFHLTADEKSEVDANCDHLKKLKFSKTCQPLLPEMAPSWLRMFSAVPRPSK